MQIADSLWIRAIQDFDFCERNIAYQKCVGNGWLSKMLNTLVTLAPDYEQVYLNGGLALTVLVSDYEGATMLFDKGTRLYPKNRMLVYAAAYHAMIEEKNEKKAADLFVKAAKSGGPDWFYSLATRLYTRSGNSEFAQGLYQELKNSGLDTEILKRMKERIDSVK